jgi:hypothetical protein
MTAARTLCYEHCDRIDARRSQVILNGARSGVGKRICVHRAGVRLHAPTPAIIPRNGLALFPSDFRSTLCLKVADRGYVILSTESSFAL